MKTEIYNELPEDARLFVEEIYHRTESAVTSMDLYYFFKDRKPKDRDEQIAFESINHISKRFAILEMSTLLDGKGKYSFKLTKDKNGNYTGVQKSKLQKMLPLKNINELEKELSRLIKKNSTLLSRMFSSRHDKIAHASVSTFKRHSTGINFRRFPAKRLYNLAKDLQFLILGYALFGKGVDRANKGKEPDVFVVK